MSIGAKTSGYVQFTGYFAPQFAGSRTKDDTYRFPLYKRPVNLKTPFATRSEIDADPAKFKLAGTEIVYLKDQFDAFVIHVNGSAKIDLPDGRSINVGHDGTNERPYTSLGKLLIANKAIPRDKISMQAIRAYFQENPGEFNGYLHQNDRYVFFRELNEKWPLGSLGIKLTPLRSIATDKTMFPPGAIALALTSLPTIKKKEDDPASRSFVQYVLDQDSGGAIKSPGRVDIFIGVGKEAGEVAGQTISKGRLIYPLLKTDRISHWLKQMKSKAGAS
jgi:membrane-bound lytic murein transglycosylase A